MKKQLPHLIIFSLVVQLSCAHVQTSVTWTEAMQTPLACALYAAQLEDDPEMITRVAIKYAEAGAFARAIEIVESIPERGFMEVLRRGFYFRRVLAWKVTSKIEAYADIAILQAKAGHHDQALNSLERAVSLAHLFELEEYWTRIAQLTKAVSGFVLIGKEDRAFAIFNDLPVNATELTTVTEGMSYAEDSLLRQKIRMLTAIANSLAKVGKAERSLQTIRQAQELFERLPLSDIVASDVVRIADVYAQLSKVELAIDLIQTFVANEIKQGPENPSSKGWNLSEYAEQLAQLGKLDEARKLAEVISHSSSQAAAFAKIAKLFAKSKNYAAALTLLSQIPTDEASYLHNAQDEIAKQLLDEGNFDKAFAIANQISSSNSKASVLAYAAQTYAARGEQAKAREAAIAAFEVGKQNLHDNGFSESAVQYILLVDKNVVLERLKEEGLKRGSGWALAETAIKLGEANQDSLAIEVLSYIQAEDYFEDAGPVTIQDYRANAIGKIAMHYYDSKRPVDAQLQAILAEFVKLLD